MSSPAIVTVDLPREFPWAPLLGCPPCFLDVETSGTNAATDRIIEIAVLRVDRPGVARAFSTLVDSGGDVGRSDIHGITRSDLRGAPRFADTLPALREILDGGVMVAHNAPFEERMLSAEFSRLGGEWAHPRLCTLALARRLHPERKGRGAHTLSNLAELYGVNVGPGHHATTDVLMLMMVCEEMLRVNASSPHFAQAVMAAHRAGDGGHRWPEVRPTAWAPKPRAPRAAAPAEDVGSAPSARAQHRTERPAPRQEGVGEAVAGAMRSSLATGTAQMERARAGVALPAPVATRTPEVNRTRAPVARSSGPERPGRQGEERPDAGTGASPTSFNHHPYAGGGPERWNGEISLRIALAIVAVALLLVVGLRLALLGSL